MSLFESFSQKERSVNFCKEETTRLQQLVDEHKDVLLCKKTDAVSTKKKEAVWINVEQKFNAVGDRHRTMKQLKYKFENMKRVAKKEASKERQERRLTGGGPAEYKPDDTTDWLRSLIPTALDGGEAIYDDDVITEPIINNIAHNKKAEIEIIDEHGYIHEVIPSISKTQQAQADEVTTIFDSSTPKSLLRKPMSSSLNRERMKKNSQPAQVEETFKKLSEARRDLQEKKKEVLLALHEEELQYWKQKRSHEQELHEQILLFNQEKHNLEISILKAKLAKE